eukprot:947932-Rhodomonas_salina.2
MLSLRPANRHQRQRCRHKGERCGHKWRRACCTCCRARSRGPTARCSAAGTCTRPPHTHTPERASAPGPPAASALGGQPAHSLMLSRALPDGELRVRILGHGSGVTGRSAADFSFRSADFGMRMADFGAEFEG